MDAWAALLARRTTDVGFLDAPKNIDHKHLDNEVRRLRALADDLVVLGIGGSSLGGQAIVHALQTDHERRVHFVDNVDPTVLGGLCERLQPERTAVLVITKSGTTVETLAQFLIVRNWLREGLGKGETKPRLVFVTDPEKGLLRELSQKQGIRAFEVPTNVGGRFSALTAVGLLPACFAGVDAEALCAGAAWAVDNPAAALALAAGARAAQVELGSDSIVFMPYSDQLRVLSQWFVQLWAESLGKRVGEQRFGQTPICAVGATDQHAQLQLFVEGPLDKVVLLIQVRKFARKLLVPEDDEARAELGHLCGRDLAQILEAERQGTRAALLGASVPVLDLSLPELTAASLGALIMTCQIACAVTGLCLGIDPFNQPGVEFGKQRALELLRAADS
jgi:glucose-6-phosphate isomerase